MSEVTLRPWRDAEGSKALGNGFHLEHHAFSAAERPIVHGAVPVVSPGTEIMRQHLRHTGVKGATHYPVIERAAEEVGKYGQQVKTHGGIGRRLRSKTMQLLSYAVILLLIDAEKTSGQVHVNLFLN